MSAASAVVFPGQGAQRRGMGRDFCERSALAREVFESCSDALGIDIAALCFDEDDRLGLTEFAQPAILTVEIAMIRVLESELGFAPSYYGGHSLGEYSALVAAGVVPVEAAAGLVRERGRLMQEAVPAGEGAMAALIQPSLDVGRLEEVLAGLEVDVANLNSTDQVVLSGRIAQLETAKERLASTPGFERARTIALRVSAPFHSRLMAPAERRYRELLEEAVPSWCVEAATRVTSNFTGAFHSADREVLVEALARQLGAPVRWHENMLTLAQHARRIVEVGPGRPLRAFFATIGHEVEAVTSVESASQVLGVRETP